MKVLWFTNTPSLASSYYNYTSHGGGWLKGIEGAVHKYTDWQLAIAFHTKSSKGQLNTKTTYYPIRNKRGKLFRVIDLIFSLTHPQLYVKKYLEIVKDYNPDIIHIFGTELPYCEILRHNTQIPIIIHIQGIMSDYQRFVLADLTRNEILFHSTFRYIVRGIIKLMEARLFRNQASQELEYMLNASYFSGRTDYDRKFVEQYSPRSKYYLLNEALRDEFYTAAKWTNPISKPFIILTTNNGELYKGIDFVLQASDFLKRQNINFEWRFAGITENDFGLKLFENKLKLNHLELNIKLLGQLGPVEIIEQIKSAHLFVHPSRIDNSPNSVCEAQLIGIPVLASNTGGIPSLVTDIKTGFLAKVSGEDFAKKIILILNNYQRAIKIAESGRETAIMRHDKKNIIFQLEVIYKDILSLVR